MKREGKTRIRKSQLERGRIKHRILSGAVTAGHGADSQSAVEQLEHVDGPLVILMDAPQRALRQGSVHRGR
ncbi:MAG: hypothetical protein WBC04_05345 [Candidatus Acidiferrales bacterium]